MSEVTVSLGPVQIPESRLWKIICWLPKKLAGTYAIEKDVKGITNHISAMTEILHIVVADLTVNWPSDKRERVQRTIANFTIVNNGLGSIKSQGNPFTADELQRLRWYTEQAQKGKRFHPEEAQDFRELSERAAREYVGQDWVKELLKVALFIFGLYALSEILKSKK